MKTNVKEEIICAGFGGQGIMVLGKILVTAAMIRGFNVSWMPSYGAEVRGGTAHSMVIISDTQIASPKIEKPTSGIIMNSPSYNKFGQEIKKGGLMLVNSSLIKDKCSRKDISIIKIPATETAFEIGNIKAANMVMAGAFIKYFDIINKDVLFESMQRVFSKRHLDLIPINKEAVERGFNLARNL